MSKLLKTKIQIAMYNETTTKELITIMSALKGTSYLGVEKGSSPLQFKIIDVRPVDAYNGWKLHNETRGGHIPGAKSLPTKWLKYIDWIEIACHKNILPENELVSCQF